MTRPERGQAAPRSRTLFSRELAMKLHMQDIPAGSNERVAEGVLARENGTTFREKDLGGFGEALSEMCFNTSMTGYQGSEGVVSRDHDRDMFSEHRTLTKTI